LKNKKKRQKLGEQGYKKMMTELNWRSIAKRLFKEYKAAVER